MGERSGGVAPGWPGIEPRWTSSAKSGVGTSASASSRVWFTLSHGILNEVYFPGTDIANTRDFGFLVADGEAYFSEEKRDCESAIDILAPGVPGFVVRNVAKDGMYSIEKTVLTHPHIDALLQQVRFSPGVPGQRLYALLAPHVQNRGTRERWMGRRLQRHADAVCASWCGDARDGVFGTVPRAKRGVRRDFGWLARHLGAQTHDLRVRERAGRKHRADRRNRR